MRASFVSSSLAIAFASVAACGKAGPVPTGDCTAAQTPAVLAIVTDSVTGLAPAGSASGLAQTGSIVDTLRPWGAQKDTLAGGAIAGNYSVRVTLAGYADWTRDNIVVSPSGFCSELNTVTLPARLVPLP